MKPGVSTLFRLTPKAFMEHPTDGLVALSGADGELVCFEALIGRCLWSRYSLLYDMSCFIAEIHLLDVIQHRRAVFMSALELYCNL